LNRFLIGDLRYGFLPYDDKSLWGIEININTPEIHVDFKNLRDFNEKFYKEYW
ncbi:MAG TPA: metal-dependent hydrolase, partial [Gammaproteobacteria bacterium]|nr:metal-dependent hydrolase [Gammaproteobacteria bacterium]